MLYPRQGHDRVEEIYASSRVSKKAIKESNIKYENAGHPKRRLTNSLRRSVSSSPTLVLFHFEALSWQYPSRTDDGSL